MEKHNIFAELVLSCYSVKSYNAIKNNGFFKRLAYHLLLTLIIFVIGIGVPYSRFMSTSGGFKSVIENYVPTFSLDSNGITIDEPKEFIEDGYVFIADTSKYFYYDDESDRPGFYSYDEATDTDTFLADIPESQGIILIDSTGIQVYNKNNGESRYIPSEELYDSLGEVNRDTVVQFVNTKAVPFVGAVSFILIFLGILFSSFISSVILLIVASVMGKTLPFMQIYNISLYARTPFRLLLALGFCIATVTTATVTAPALIVAVGTTVFGNGLNIGLYQVVIVAVYSASILKRINTEEDTEIIQ